MRALVFSHTIMGGGQGFCVTIGNEVDGGVYQWRLRVRPNQSLLYTHFGIQGLVLRRQLRPGSIIEIEHPFQVAAEDRRITHPEDVVMAQPPRMEIVDPHGGVEHMSRLAERLAFGSVAELFPGMFADNQKWYRPGREPNARAVGYVRVQAVDFFLDGDNLRAWLTDEAGNRFNIKVVGIDLVNREVNPQNIYLARLSLANPFAGQYWAHTAHPSRCYLMLSHVIGR